MYMYNENNYSILSKSDWRIRSLYNSNIKLARKIINLPEQVTLPAYSVVCREIGK